MRNMKAKNNIDNSHDISSRIFCRFGNSCLFILILQDISGDQ